MDKIFISVIVVIFLIIAITFLPDLTSATQEMITDSDTMSGDITTGGGETSGDVTLPQPLYNDETQYVSSITSSHGPDNPVASAYSGTTDALTVGGLAESQTRTVTVTYAYDATGDFVGLRSGGRMLPTLILLMVIALAGAGIWRMFSSR